MRAALLVACAVLMTGCVGGGGGDPRAAAGTPSPSPSAAPSAGAEPRAKPPDLRAARGTATYCVPRYAHRSERPAVADFNARHRGDGLRARLRTLPLHAGRMARLLRRGCDVAHVDMVWIAGLAHAGLLADLTDYMAPRRDDFRRPALDAMRWEDRYWAVPRSVETSLVFHDDAISPPLSWTQLYARARENDGFTYAGARDVPLAIHFVDVAYAAGARVLAPGGDRSEIDSPAAVRALELMRSGINTEAVLPEVLQYDEQDALLAFVDERATYLRDNPRTHTVLEREEQDDYDEFRHALGPLPFDDRGDPVSALAGYAVVVSDTARDPDAALALADDLTRLRSVELAARHAGAVPALKVVWDRVLLHDEIELRSQIDTALEYARPLPVTPAYPLVMDAIARHVHDALAGRVPPADALRRADREIEAALSQLRVAGGEVS